MPQRVKDLAKRAFSQAEGEAADCKAKQMEEEVRTGQFSPGHIHITDSAVVRDADKKPIILNVSGGISREKVYERHGARVRKLSSTKCAAGANFCMTSPTKWRG